MQVRLAIVVRVFYLASQGDRSNPRSTYGQSNESTDSSTAACYVCQTYAKHKGEGEIAPKANQPTYAQLLEAAAPPMATTELGQ